MLLSLSTSSHRTLDIQLAKKLFEDKGVKYTGKKDSLWSHYSTLYMSCSQTSSSSITAIELDKEADGSQLRESIGTKTPAIWIRGQFIGDFNALNKLNTNGELDTLIKFIPKTTHKSPR